MQAITSGEPTRAEKFGLLGVLVLFLNLGVGLWAMLGVEVIASHTGMIAALCYGIGSGVLFWRLSKPLASRLGASSQRTIAITSAACGVFGWFAFSHGFTYAYSRAIGTQASSHYTVVASYWASGGKYRSCYEQHLSGVLWLAVSAGLLCTDRPFAVGSHLVVEGPRSVFGQAVDRMYASNGT